MAMTALNSALLFLLNLRKQLVISMKALKNCLRVVDGEDDDVKDDTDKVDDKTEENWFLTLRNCNAPHQAG